MNEHLFSGFYTDGLLTVSDTEQLILEMRNIVTKRSCASYQKLVAKLRKNKGNAKEKFAFLFISECRGV